MIHKYSKDLALISDMDEDQTWGNYKLFAIAVCIGGVWRWVERETEST
jgi:hypothetical protein